MNNNTLVVNVPKPTKRPYDVKINRWTGLPHENVREKARNLRQLAKKTKS